MSAKEKVLKEAPGWSEEQAERALRAAGRGIVDEWGDLDAFSARGSLGVLRHMEEEEEKVGFSWEKYR